MLLRASPLLLIAASLLVKAGCGGEVDPIAVAPGCPDQPLRGPVSYASEPASQLIDDFEIGDLPSDLLIAKVAPRDGYWVRGSDLYDPTYASGTLITEKSTRCPARGDWSGHFEAHGFTNWNINWTAVFRAAASGNNATPFDARAYGGISFWAAFGGDNGTDFAVPVGVTTMDNAWNGGICSSTCMDFYGTTVPLTHGWRRYQIRFAELAQAGWGAPQVPVIREDQMVGFIIWPRQQFDIWIDDVRFEL
jgi:hypothetical protein